MAVSFNEIPLSLLTPGVFAELDTSRAVQGISTLPHESLITGQMLAAGSATAGAMYVIDSAAQAASLFGAGSQLAQMAAAYKAADPLTPLFACGLADIGGGTAATGGIDWTGTATEAGSLVLYLGGRRVVVAVPDGMTAADLETAALAALALETDLPVTVAGDSSTGLDITAKHKGAIGNQIMLGVCLLDDERVPAGISVTVTAMSGGATDPDFDAVVTAMSEDQYATTVTGLVDATETGTLITELESRLTALRAIEGTVFGAKYDTRANLTTLGNSFNSAVFCLIGAEPSALLPLPWELAAKVAGMDALQAKTDPARATGGQLVPGTRGAHRGARFTRAQRDILLSDGIATVATQRDGRLLLERLVTTYQTNTLGLADPSLRDQQVLRLFAAIRYSTRARVAQRFARFKLVGDESTIPPGQPMTNPKGIKAEIVALANEWRLAGWIENLGQFTEELYVERDQNDPNRVNMVLPPDFVNNLLVVAAKISYKL